MGVVRGLWWVVGVVRVEGAVVGRGGCGVVRAVGVVRAGGVVRGLWWVVGVVGCVITRNN